MEVNIRLYGQGTRNSHIARGPDGLGQVLLTRLVGHNQDESHFIAIHHSVGLERERVDRPFRPICL